MTKSKSVYTAVSALYGAKTTPNMGKWMWNNHVQWVANKAKFLAEKYGANAEKAYCAAIIHDLGDSRHGRYYKNFAAWSEKKGRAVLFKAGFSEDEATEIVEIIVRPHSCRPGNLPTTLEGRVLATADAMWHLQTSFFPMLLYKRRPQTTHSYEEWQIWFSEKIERDYNVKIFFKDEHAEVKDDYEALSRIFRNNTLHSKEG